MTCGTPSLGDLLLKRNYAAMLDRQVEMRRSFGLAFYEPHYKQDLFHRGGIYQARYGRTGNRFGKSIMGAAEDCSWALGYRPFYQRPFDIVDGKGKVRRQHDPERDAELVYSGIPQRNVKGLIIVTDWDKAEEVFTNRTDGESRGKLFKLLPEDKIKDVITNQSGKICTIIVESIWGGMSSIHLDTVKSFKSNRLGQESSDWDFLHIDEPCPKEMFDANARGLVDRSGSEWFTCTPLSEMWINDYFLPEGNIKDEFDAPNVAALEIKDDEGNVEVIKRWMITGSMHDNPTLTAGGKAKFISQLSEEDRETRVEGRPRALAGAIYREFDRDKHVYRAIPFGWTDYNKPPANYTIRLAIDTHPVNPHAVLFAATSPTGHVYFYNEIYAKEYIRYLCTQIYTVLNGRWPLRCLLELAAYNENPVDGITLADEFHRAQLPVEPAVKDLQGGIMMVKQMLMKEDSRGNKWFQFAPNLTETLREFDRYVWDEKTQKPIDKYDHMMECLYRLTLTGLEYVDPAESESRPVQVLNVISEANKPYRLPRQEEDVMKAFETKSPWKRSRYNGDFRSTSEEERALAVANTRAMRNLRF